MFIGLHSTEENLSRFHATLVIFVELGPLQKRLVFIHIATERDVIPHVY